MCSSAEKYWKGYRDAMDGVACSAWASDDYQRGHAAGQQDRAIERPYAQREPLVLLRNPEADFARSLQY